MSKRICISCRFFVKICAVFAFLTLPHLSYAARNIKSAYTDYQSKGNNMRSGINYNWLYIKSNSIGLFFEHNFGVPLIGVSTGIEYGTDKFFITPKDIELKNIDELDIEKYRNKPEILSIVKSLDVNKPFKDITAEQKKIAADFVESEWGMYQVSFLSVPLIIRFYPMAGDFCLFGGVRMDYLLSIKGVNFNNSTARQAVAYRKLFTKVSGSDTTFSQWIDIFDEVFRKAEDIDRDDKNLRDEPCFNSTRWNLMAGIRHTFSFGLMIGLLYTHSISNFVNYNEEMSHELLNYNIQATIGVDIIKTINFF